VEGDGAPHINRSVEVEAMPGFGDRFFPDVAELHPGTRALVRLLKRSRNAASMKSRRRTAATIVHRLVSAGLQESVPLQPDGGCAVVRFRLVLG
jgi:hypothetical protein